MRAFGWLACVLAPVLAAGSHALAAPMSVAGFSFPGGEVAFADDALLVSGTGIGFTCAAGVASASSFAEALSGSDINQCVNAQAGGDGVVEVLFVDNKISNGDGTDLVIFEVSGPQSVGVADPTETFSVSVFDGSGFSPSVSFDPVATGFATADPTLEVFAVEIDLSTYGIAPLATVDRVRVHIQDNGFGSKGADVAALGAIHSVPAANEGAPGAGGNLFVSSPTTDEVLQFDTATGELVGPFVSAGEGGLDTPTGLSFGPNGNLFVVSQGDRFEGDDSILEFDGTTGAFVGTLVAGPTNLLYNELGAAELSWGQSGDLFVSNWADNFFESAPETSIPEAFRINSEGVVVRSYQSGASCVYRPDALALGEDDWVYLSSRAGDAQNVYAYGPYGLCSSPQAFAAVGGPSDGIEFGPNGNLFVSRRDSNDVLEFNGTTGALWRAFVAAGSGGIQTPGDVKFGPNGNLFVVNGDGRIFEYDGDDGGFVRVLTNTTIEGHADTGSRGVRIAFKPVPEPSVVAQALIAAFSLAAIRGIRAVRT